MGARLEVPSLDDLAALGVLAESSDDGTVVSVTTWAGDGDLLILTWDEIANSASVRWSQGGQERLALEREMVSRISVRSDGGEVQFRVWSRCQHLSGALVVKAGARVTVRDAVLRT